MAGARQLKLKDSDKALVRRFARQNDGEAFSQLMDRYADMVYTTAWRILQDKALAADAVQETFFQLAQNAEKVTGCLGGWLHRVATRRAVDLIRQNVSRRNPLADQMRDAAGDHAGFAGAGARQNQHGAVKRFNGQPLLRIERSQIQHWPRSVKGGDLKARRSAKCDAEFHRIEEMEQSKPSPVGTQCL